MECSNLLTDVLHLSQTLVLIFDEILQGLNDSLVVLDFPVFKILEIAIVGLFADVDLGRRYGSVLAFSCGHLVSG